MNAIILNHIKTRRPLYSSNSNFLLNECTNRFISDTSVFACIDNQAHILVEILYKTEYKTPTPIYVMMNEYYYKKMEEFLYENNI